MTYLVLARKWRPRSFDTLIGQDHVVRALTHALSTQRLHHAWLFTGTRGVGKTTLSRILAKSLNCETGITATPCGVCRACTEIDEGRFVDYVELDAASNRGVDEMTQLLEQAVYAPGSGRFKVYMIDEVHMLTGHAFNAMLKTLEEPPPHVKFILATTDPQKIPVTVLSRCLQFNLKQMTAEAIVGHLQEVLGQEQIPAEVPALRLLAQAASGSMRDALSLTDQAIAYSAGNLTTDAVQGMLGTIDQGHLVVLLRALAAGDASAVLRVADELAARGLSYSGALADLAVLLSRIAIQQRIPGAAPADDPLVDDIRLLGEVLHPDQVQLFYSVAVHSRQELSLAPDEYAGFVMACLRMLALVPAGTEPPKGGPAPEDSDDGSDRPEPAPHLVDANALTDASPGAEAGAETGATSAAAQRVTAAGRPAATAPLRAAAAAVVRAVTPSTEAHTAPAATAAVPARVTNTAPAAKPDEPAAVTGAAVIAVSQHPERPGAADPRDIPAWEDEPAAVTVDAPAPPSARGATLSSGGTASGDTTSAVAPTSLADTAPVITSNAQAGTVPVITPASSYGEAPAHGASGADETVVLDATPEAESASAIESAPDADMAPAVDSAPQPDKQRGIAASSPDDAGHFVEDDFEAFHGRPFESIDEDEGGRYEPVDAGDADFETMGEAMETLSAPVFATERKKAGTPRIRDMNRHEWPALAASLPLTGLAAELARQSEWLGAEGDQVNLRVAIKTLAESPGKSRLCTVLSEHFGTVVRVQVEYGATGDETAYAVAQAEKARRQQQAEIAVANDPFVKTLIAEFDARVVDGSIVATPDSKAA
ncbi:DNA polymerase III subunit gamma/tau [Parapusillimonas sp. SGNA-6]|nr:DNA polymerase III subunit gamma/tau [Parapusillimonas sp. SGNA-6]